MNLAKVTGVGLIAASKITNQEWILIISIIITVLGMIQDYLENRRKK